VTSGLFLRSLQNASSIDMGFQPEGVETLTLDLTTQGYDEVKGREFNRQLMERVAALPGVHAASLARMVPLNGNNMMTHVNVGGQPLPAGERGNMVGLNVVEPSYFKTVEMPILLGRSFNENDKRGAPAVAIINQTMAGRFYPGANASAALGQSLNFGGDDERIIIIGIVRDAKYETLGEAPLPYLYRPFQQSYSGEMTLHIRTGPGDVGNVLAGVRREVAGLDKDLPLLNVMPMTEQIGFSLMPLRLAATVAGTLGLLGLLLAALGVFGVVNYSVTQRTREIGIRISLGAQSRNMLRLIVGQGLWLAVIGVVIGLAGAFALTRLLTSLLYGVSALDPVVFAGVAILMVAVTLVASYIPARRATKVDPLVALRYE
ncbi:MAG: FtsX-like permease family protein, partial [Gammaproteobacteria bacterium]